MSRRLSQNDRDQRSCEFGRQAETPPVGIVREFFDFLVHNKKWWLTPIVVVLLLLGVLMFLGGSGLSPFIYTLF